MSMSQKARDVGKGIEAPRDLAGAVTQKIARQGTASKKRGHSIRWRLALGSILISLLATTLLSLAILLAVNHYYSVDQRTRLQALSVQTSQQIGSHVTNTTRVADAATSTLRTEDGNNQSNYLTLVYARRFVNGKRQPGGIVYPPSFGKLPGIYKYLFSLIDPTANQTTSTQIGRAVSQGFRGISVIDEIQQNRPGPLPRPFVVQPIRMDGTQNGRVVGVLLMIPRSAADNSLPPFLATVQAFVLIIAIVVAGISALAALLFARTITRPLVALTNAAQVMAAGDYSTRVKTEAKGELGALAEAFNDMAIQLERDINELQQQEIWRRELIMNITHDLATPLTAIAGLGESLVDGVNQSREDYETAGRIINRETLRLHRLVKDLHLMAKMESHAIEPDMVPVRLASLVDDVLAVLVPEFERNNVEPRNLVSFDLPQVQADPDMLSRVFSNLCSNAVRHTPSGGFVQIEAVEAHGLLYIAVTDSGEGIPPEALRRVFDRFFRADSARQSKIGGSGLGLAIVKAIVEAQGGKIWAENVPEGGARLIFTLHLSPQKPILSQQG